MKRHGKRLAVLGTALAVFVVASVAFAAWVVNGTGNGYAKAKTAVPLSSNDVSATTASQLYPGGSGDVKLQVKNDNPFPVTITQVEQGAGAISSDKAGCTDVGGDASKATGVSMATQALASGNVVPANGTLDITLSNAASMTNASVNACQGAVFTIPVSFAAGS